MAASCALCLLATELGARLLVQPAELAYATLFRMALPPFEFVDPARGIHQDREGPYRGLVVNGRTITLGDVAGYHRYHSVLGYANRENTISVNRW